MMAASEEVAEFVGKKNGEKREGKRQARKESGGMLVEKFVGADEFLERGGLIPGISIRELSSGGETSAKREKEQHDGENESPAGRAWRNWKVG